MARTFSLGAGALIPDNPNWRRHKNACVFYRERWCADEEAGDEGCVLLYQIICLQNTPPISPAEQALCMKARTACWRLRPAGADGEAAVGGGRARRR